MLIIAIGKSKSKPMQVNKSALPDVLVIEPKVFGDARGFFKETYHRERYRELGIGGDFVQDNFSRSCKGTLRGLHYQIRHAQGKLVHVVHGKVFDVAVDLRRSSPNFGKWMGVELSDENHRQVYVPPGFAHGFCVLSELADVVYKCTDIYSPQHERTLLWNDSELGIDWPVDGEPILSEKDLQGIPFADAECYE